MLMASVGIEEVGGYDGGRSCSRGTTELTFIILLRLEET